MSSDKKLKKMSPAGKHRLYLMNIIGLCVVTLVSLAGAVYVIVQLSDTRAQMLALQEELDALAGEEKSLYTQEELEAAEEAAREEGAETERGQILMQIQSDMQSGASTATMLRSLFSDDIVVVSGGKYYFYPVLEEIAANSYSSEDFSLTEDGRLCVTGSDDIRVQNGIDVTEDVGDIDWASVSEDDITFVMVRAGERLAADTGDAKAGDLVADSALEDHILGASEAGLGVGVFWTLGAVSAKEAAEEADYLVGLLSESQSMITGYVAVRLNVPAETDRTAGQGRADWTEYVTLFCETLEEAGYTPMIYGNLASFVMSLDLEELEAYGWARWISNSGASLYFPYEFAMWQYSTEGTVQGISTQVSLNAILNE